MLNRKLKKLIIGGCMLVMAGTVIGGCGTSTQTTSNKLIVGTNATFVPFEFKDEKTQDYTGFDIDLIRAIGKRINKDVELKNVAFDALIPALNTHDIDVAASGMTITKARSEKVLFSSPYYENALAVVYKDGANITSLDDLKGKKIAMTWAYSPSYGKPLSVPQGAIGLFTRLGMEVVLAHPEGYEVMPEVEEIAKKQAEASGGSFRRTNDMKDAFKDADIVYPKSWAPFGAMEKRTKLYGENDHEGIKALEKVLLEENGKHKDWACTEEMMSLTKDGKALYLHCLPADITGVSCEEGEVDATVFDRYRIPLYKEASYKPYVIAAMIFLSKFKNPVETLKELERKGTDRVQP